MTDKKNSLSDELLECGDTISESAPTANDVCNSEILIKGDEYLLLRTHKNGRNSAYLGKLSKEEEYELIEFPDQNLIDQWLEKGSIMFTSKPLKKQIDIINCVELFKKLKNWGNL